MCSLRLPLAFVPTPEYCPETELYITSMSFGGIMTTIYGHHHDDIQQEMQVRTRTLGFSSRVAERFRHHSEKR